MKKFIALAIAVLMLAALAVPAFAAATETELTATGDEYIEDASKLTQTGTVEVTYSLNETYTVTIPADIAFTEDDIDGETKSGIELSIDNAMLGLLRTLTVAINGGLNYDDVNGDFRLKHTRNVDETDDVVYEVYEITADSVAVAKDDVLLSLSTFDVEDAESAHSASTELAFTLGSVDVAGAYSDTLTFTVALVDDAAAKIS